MDKRFLAKNQIADHITEFLRGEGTLQSVYCLGLYQSYAGRRTPAGPVYDQSTVPISSYILGYLFNVFLCSVVFVTMPLTNVLQTP